MNCKICNTELSDTDCFCPNCGIRVREDTPEIHKETVEGNLLKNIQNEEQQHKSRLSTTTFVMFGFIVTFVMAIAFTLRTILRMNGKL